MSAATPRHVLVVDDDALNRKLIETLLRADGHVVTVVDSGPAALAALAGAVPDLVVLDLMMPGMDGFEVARRLRAGPRAAVPVLMVTALDDEASRARLAAAGIEHVLTKPIDRWCFKAAVDELLRTCGGDRERT